MNIAIKSGNINTREALAGKVSLITGSTSGIGLGIARALAAAGAGSSVTRDGAAGASLGMALATAVAMLCYAVNLVILGKSRG